MAKPTITEQVLKNGDAIAVVWQEVDEGVAEQALSIRTYKDSFLPMIEIRQGDHEILINGETMKELSRLLKRMIG